MAPRKPAQRHPNAAHFPAVGTPIDSISRCASRAMSCEKLSRDARPRVGANRPSGQARAQSGMGSFSCADALSRQTRKREEGRFTDARNLGGIGNHTNLASEIALPVEPAHSGLRSRFCPTCRFAPTRRSCISGKLCSQETMARGSAATDAWVVALPTAGKCARIGWRCAWLSRSHLLSAQLADGRRRQRHL